MERKHRYRAAPTAPARDAPLSRREREVARCVVGGATNQTIALTLKITEKTVEKHLSHIFRKLNVASRAQLAVFIIAGERPTL